MGMKMEKGMRQSLAPPIIKFYRKSNLAFSRSSSPARAYLEGGEMGSEARVRKQPSKLMSDDTGVPRTQEKGGKGASGGQRVALMDAGEPVARRCSTSSLLYLLMRRRLPNSLQR